MIEEILESENMKLSYARLKKNKGSAGIDRMDLSALSSYIKTNWKSLVREIKSNKYCPSSILGVEIPKTNGKTRLLGIPTLLDRLMQQAVNQTLYPLFEPEFRKSNYGFRKGCSAHDAIKQAHRNINEGFHEIIDIDLSNFFDEVEHVYLMELLYSKVKCPVTLRLIRKWLKSPISINGKLKSRKKGIPQGSPLSPLLSNIVLTELDRELEKRGHRYVRYADDFSIYLKSKRAARRVMRSISSVIEDRLKLKINHEKSGIRRPSRFKILGYEFVPTYETGVRGKYQLVAGKEAWQRLKWKIKIITRKTSPLSFEERIKRLKLCQSGWLNYFNLASIREKLKVMDNWVRNRIRYCIWHNWKKPERKRKNLIRLGKTPRQAYAWSRTRMGGWAVACSPILKTTITVKRLEARGYESMYKYYRKTSDA